MTTRGDVQESYNKFMHEKNRLLTYKKNNENEKEFIGHLYFFNWMIFVVSIVIGYKAYKLYQSGPPIWESMSAMLSTITFGFLGNKQTMSD